MLSSLRNTGGRVMVGGLLALCLAFPIVLSESTPDDGLLIATQGNLGSQGNQVVNDRGPDLDPHG